MPRIVYSSRFKKDLKRARKRGLPLDRLEKIIDQLIAGDDLPPACRDHALHGEWSGYRECHILPDWLLIYRKTDETLYLVRTGSHADLFE